ncbi:MAG: DUF6134 family protein [Xanthomonadales bacterium]|nr:DUF6134 family protein [Xanthomonadales bacterium]
MLNKIALMIASLVFYASVAAADQEWRFQVYLDDKKIGTHDFVLQQLDKQRKLKSEANFEYRLMFVKLYGYEHENTETWVGDCLTGIESKTDANGKPFKVSGSLQGDRFLLRGTAGEAELPSCSMSFAYWNPVFLQQERLINVQNGEVHDIEVSEPELVQIEVRGVMQPAYRYLLDAGELKIELWYSEDNEWLALETDARGGRRLRYQLL